MDFTEWNAVGEYSVRFVQILPVGWYSPMPIGNGGDGGDASVAMLHLSFMTNVFLVTVLISMLLRTCAEPSQAEYEEPSKK